MGPDRTDSFDFDALFLRTKTLSTRINGYRFNLLLAALLFARKSGNHRYRLIRNGLISGMNVTPLLQQESRGIAAEYWEYLAERIFSMY